MNYQDVIARINTRGIFQTLMLVMVLSVFCAATPVMAATAKSKKTKVTQRITKKQSAPKVSQKKTPAKNKKSSLKAAVNKPQPAPRSSLASTVSRRGPAGISDSQRELEIRGQSRNLSMLLVLKNRNENIDFVKPRDSYREEIQQTGY